MHDIVEALLSAAEDYEKKYYFPCNLHRMAAAEIERLRTELEAVTRERDAAFAMSLCECAADECCANLVAKDDQIAKVREQTARECAEICRTQVSAYVPPANIAALEAEKIINKRFGL